MKKYIIFIFSLATILIILSLQSPNIIALGGQDPEPVMVLDQIELEHFTSAKNVSLADYDDTFALSFSLVLTDLSTGEQVLLLSNHPIGEKGVPASWEIKKQIPVNGKEWKLSLFREHMHGKEEIANWAFQPENSRHETELRKNDRHHNIKLFLRYKEIGT